MFCVLKKDNIMAFIVACSTVFVLFLMTSIFAKPPENTVVTVSQNINNESIEKNNEVILNSN